MDILLEFKLNQKWIYYLAYTTDAIKLVSRKHALLPRQWSNVLTSNTMVTRLETKLASPIAVLLDYIQKLQLKSEIG
jgi:hypothetical protein